MKEIVGDHQLTPAPATETFISRLTAAGRGAIAVVRVWGPRAIEFADSVFRQDRGARLSETPCGDLRVGRIGSGLGDEVVAVVLTTVPPVVEVQCHGGDAAVSLVVEAFQRAGAKLSEKPRLAARPSNDPFADLAMVDLAQTQTLTTAEVLLDQMHGALRRELVRLGRTIAHQPDLALVDLDALIGRAEVGLRLLDGWKVAIAGRPNVGKSRLFNALVGFTRAIVDPTPGTTRDVVSFRVSFAGWPVELADTAGLRAAVDPVENLGIERSRCEQQQADLIVLVLDHSLALQPIDEELIESNPAAILVGNKSDLPPAWHADDRRVRSRAIVRVSAARGDGLDALIDSIIRRLVPEPPPEGAAVPFRVDQVDRLRQTYGSLLSGDRDQALRELGSMIERRE